MSEIGLKSDVEGHLASDEEGDFGHVVVGPRFTGRQLTGAWFCFEPDDKLTTVLWRKGVKHVCLSSATDRPNCIRLAGTFDNFLHESYPLQRKGNGALYVEVTDKHVPGELMRHLTDSELVLSAWISPDAVVSIELPLSDQSAAL